MPKPSATYETDEDKSYRKDSIKYMFKTALYGG